MQDYIVEKAIEYIKDLFRNNSDGHDADHSIRVYYNAMMIAGAYPTCNRYVVALAAILHDVDDYKLFDTVDNANAKAFLENYNFEEDIMESICKIISEVSFSKNQGKKPDSIEGEIVQDADRLDAIGAIGIARTFAYGGKHGRSLDESLQHFYEKLLLLRDKMNTEPAKEIANMRHTFMETYLREYIQESKR